MKRTYFKLLHSRPGHRRLIPCQWPPGTPGISAHRRSPGTPGFGIRMVKITITILLAICFSTSCEKHPFISFHSKNQHEIIALQPFGNFNDQQLTFIRDAISTLFRTPVIILKPVDIPVTYRAVGEEKYLADSLIMFLSKFTNDRIVDVVGLTHNDIYTIHEYKTHEKNVPAVLYEPKGIFGYGYVSGNSCIVSDYRLMSKDQELVNNRLRKVIIHEIGHNLGLPHCTTDTCIMFEGDIPALDKCHGNYCDKCRWVLK
jgi:archaemetzincin